MARTLSQVQQAVTVRRSLLRMTLRMNDMCAFTVGLLMALMLGLLCSCCLKQDFRINVHRRKYAVIDQTRNLRILYYKALQYLARYLLGLREVLKCTINLSNSSLIYLSTLQ